MRRLAQVVVAVFLGLTMSSSARADDLADAKAATDAYFQGRQIVEVTEGKNLMAANSWGAEFPNFAERDMLVFKDSKVLFDGLFDTDVPGVKGFKRLMQVTLVSQGRTEMDRLLGRPGTPAGATTDEKWMAIVFQDRTTKKWKVLSSRKAADTRFEAEAITKRITMDSSVPMSIRYRQAAFWLLLDGKVAEASKAIDESKKHPPSDKPEIAANWAASLPQYESIIDRITGVKRP
jgi:hypothetical protein